MFNDASFRSNGTPTTPEAPTPGSMAPVLPRIQVGPEFRIPLRAPDVQQPAPALGTAAPLIPLRTAVAPTVTDDVRQRAATALQASVNGLVTQGRLAPEQASALQHIIKDPAIGAARLNLIRQALSHLGKNYNWGSTGPKQFDCSGLTGYCMKQELGIKIPRTAAYQAKSGLAVKRDDLKAGDLLYFGSKRITHTAIYLGDGLMLEAGGEGRVRSDKGSVRIRSIRDDFKLARRYISDDSQSLPKVTFGERLARGIFDYQPVQSVFDWLSK